MKFTQIAKYVLPPVVVDVARWLLAGRRLTRPEAGHVSTHYEVVPEWMPPKEGTGTLDFDVAKRPADMDTISPSFPPAHTLPNGTILAWIVGQLLCSGVVRLILGFSLRQ